MVNTPSITPYPPLTSCPSGTPPGIGFWQLIYNGVETSFADLGLTTYTTYQYRITVSNDIGLLTSDPSQEVTTLAGRPSLGGSISAVAVDHVTVSLTWTTPSKTTKKSYS